MVEWNLPNSQYNNGQYIHLVHNEKGAGKIPSVFDRASMITVDETEQLLFIYFFFFN